jgi:hypothetical protein
MLILLHSASKIDRSPDISSTPSPLIIIASRRLGFLGTTRALASVVHIMQRNVSPFSTLGFLCEHAIRLGVEHSGGAFQSRHRTINHEERGKRLEKVCYIGSGRGTLVQNFIVTECP